MLTLNGELDLQISTQEDRDEVEMTFHDGAARVVAFRATMTRSAFAMALGRRGYIPCRLEVNQSGCVGMKHETKTERVFVPNGDSVPRQTRALDAVKAYQEDGWVGRVENATNHHNMVQCAPEGETYRVIFDRYVPKGVETD